MSRKELTVLVVIVLAQFMCTSLWFAGNAVLPQLVTSLSLTAENLGWMTSSVQFGFIVGTLIYAFLTIADKFNASNVFLISALLGAAANALITLQSAYLGILFFRFLTGLFLAGIYPVGMKIASDHFAKGLGKAMSFLVGALVLGTALPHLIASLDSSLDWRKVLHATSILAITGGLLIKLFVGEGPFKKIGQKPRFADMASVFKRKEFRGAAFGYFGHMWELYAFWAFVPVILRASKSFQNSSEETISLWSFVVIALGALSCFAGGYLSEKFGTKKMAGFFLLSSGVCCLLSPLVFGLGKILFLAFVIFWGLVVIADSPLFSTLVAQNANPEIKGTALTLVTSIGFAITIFSIQLLSYLGNVLDERYLYLILLAGPLFGLAALKK